MVYDPTKPPTGQTRSTQLKLVFTQVLNLNPEAIQPTNTYWMLRAGTTRITNVRVWRNSMEEEVQPITLNQFVVRDQDQALLIDNAIPPLRMVKNTYDNYPDSILCDKSRKVYRIFFSILKHHLPKWHITITWFQG